MIDITYEASSGKRYNLMADTLRIKDANFHSYSWMRDTAARRYGEKVSRFTKDAQEYQTTLYITGKDRDVRAQEDVACVFVVVQRFLQPWDVGHVAVPEDEQIAVLILPLWATSQFLTTGEPATMITMITMAL